MILSAKEQEFAKCAKFLCIKESNSLFISVDLKEIIQISSWLLRFLELFIVDYV